MSKNDTSLPEGFESLEPFVAQWAIDNAPDRDAMRGRASAGERKAFYDAALAGLDDALDLLDQKPLADLDPPEQRLMRLMLSFAHVSIAEEIQSDDEEKHAYLRSFMPITRAPADF